MTMGHNIARAKIDTFNKKVFFGLDNLTRTHKKAIRHASFDIGREMQKDTRKRIKTGNKTGRVYKIGGRVHRSSAPGEAPANLSGKLERSVDYVVRSHKQIELGYKALHGKFLEDGTKNMEGRPNLVNVSSASVQKFINYMAVHYARLSK